MVEFKLYKDITKLIMKTREDENVIPPMKRGKLNIYKPSDIKRWGTQQFLEKVSPKEPIQPNFNFSEEEQKRMDQLLAEERD